MARVLYISYDGLSDPLGQSQILPYLTRLRRREYHITIISFEKPDRYNGLGAEIHRTCAVADIQWEPLTYHKRPAVLSTLYDLSVLRATIQRLQANRSYEIVHCRSYVPALAGLWMKHRYKTKFIFDMRGFWADERVDGNIWKQNNPVYRLVYRYFKRKEKEFLQKADWTVCLTERAKNEIGTWGLGPLRISVIPTCVDLELFDPDTITDAQRNEQREKLGFGVDDFVLIYLGSWGTWYSTKEMLDFFRQMRARVKAVRFLIVTPDAVQIDDSSVTVIRARREDVPLMISLSDQAIFFIKPSYSKMASSATKLGEILAMGVPLITNRGWGDIDSYRELLPEAISYDTDPVQAGRRRVTIKAREFCQKYLSLEVGVASYSEMYGALCDQTLAKE